MLTRHRNPPDGRRENGPLVPSPDDVDTVNLKSVSKAIIRCVARLTMNPSEVRMASSHAVLTSMDAGEFSAPVSMLPSGAMWKRRPTKVRVRTAIHRYAGNEMAVFFL